MIYIYILDNRTWADFSKPEGAQTVKEIRTTTRAQCRRVVRKPGKVLSGRVIALAERALSEFPEKTGAWVRIKKAARVLRYG